MLVDVGFHWGSDVDDDDIVNQKRQGDHTSIEDASPTQIGFRVCTTCPASLPLSIICHKRNTGHDVSISQCKPRKVQTMVHTLASVPVPTNSRIILYFYNADAPLHLILTTFTQMGRQTLDPVLGGLRDAASNLNILRSAEYIPPRHQQMNIRLSAVPNTHCECRACRSLAKLNVAALLPRPSQRTSSLSIVDLTVSPADGAAAGPGASCFGLSIDACSGADANSRRVWDWYRGAAGTAGKRRQI
jgi:hypothetical protein